MSLNDKKERLNQQINDIKVDIQYLLDKKKTTKKNTEEYTKIESMRLEKMDTLHSLHNELKNINSELRKIKQSEYEINKASREIDSLQYFTAKKKNNENALSKAKEEKIVRDEARKKYLEYLEEQRLYFERDPTEIPGILFLHEKILNEYGLCKYINININNNNNNSNNEHLNKTKFLHDNRKLWLDSQKDAGKLYYDLYGDIFLKKSLESNLSKKQEIEDTIENWLKNNMEELQYKLYVSTINMIEEYTKTNVKTKKIKEKYKILINNLSIIYSETTINIHEYLSLKYNTHFLINQLNLSNNNNRMINVTYFTIYLDEYKSILEKIIQKEKYITNTIKNLKNELYLYLTKQKRFDSVENVQIKQIGKYYKRWKDLNKLEREERFESFSKYYIEKYMINKGILSEIDKEKTINQLTELLKSNVNMKYRDFVWKTKLGIIESIKILKYNQETSEFYLLKQDDKDKNKNNNKNSEESTEVTEENKQNTKNKKKRISNKSIITKDNEEKINEEILFYIIKKKISDLVDEQQNEQKNIFLERIKNIFRIKKLSISDKELIIQKYDEILSVIKMNQRHDNVNVSIL